MTDFGLQWCDSKGLLKCKLELTNSIFESSLFFTSITVYKDGTTTYKEFNRMTDTKLDYTIHNSYHSIHFQKGKTIPKCSNNVPVVTSSTRWSD